MFKFYLYKFGEYCVNHLPPWLAYKIAQLLSDVQYYFSPRDRRAVSNNLKVILGNPENLSYLTREVFRNFGRYLVEFFRMANAVNKDYIQEKIQSANLERLDEVLKKGKGAILLTAHIGNWELGGVVLSSLGYSVTAVALPHKERPVNDLFNKQREIRGLTIIPPHGAIRKCIETLKNNQMVALVADRDFTLSGEALNFFGRPTMIPKGPAVFAEKTGAPILPLFLIRQGTMDNFILHMDEPIYPPTVNDPAREKQTVLNLMRTYTKVIEREIRKHPTQWLMFREFWIK